MTTDEQPQGHDNPYCGANKRQEEGTCRRPAGWGTTHPGIGACKLHGGSTANHKAAAQTELARRAVQTYGLPREVAPDVALLEEVYRTAGHVAWLGAKVAELDEDDLVWGLVEQADKRSTEFPGVDRTDKAAPNIWLVLYQQERKHLTAVSKAALDAGVAERQVRLAEKQAELMAGAVRRITDGLLAAVVELADEMGQGDGAEGVARISEAIRQAWPGWMGEIAPREFRAMTGGSE